MESLNHFRGIGKVGSRFPGPFANFIILPMNKVLQFLSIDARIKDLEYLKFFSPSISIRGGDAYNCYGIVDTLYGFSKEHKTLDGSS